MSRGVRPPRGADYFGAPVDARYSQGVAQVAEAEIEGAEAESHLCIAYAIVDSSGQADAQARPRFILV